MITAKNDTGTASSEMQPAKPKNIFILTLGSRGDVQPYVALGKGFQAAGHNVTVCTSSSFESFITGQGLNYGHMSNDLLDLMDSAEGRAAIENTVGAFGAIKTTMKLMQDAKTINRKLLRDSWESAQAAEPDLVIYHPKALGGAHIAEKLGIPAVLAVTAPVIVPTSIYPVVGMPSLKLGGWYNRLGYQLVNKGYTVYDGIANDFRQEVLGLEKTPRAALATQMPDGRPILVLHCISQHVLPRPEDWPDHAQLSGYWFLDQADRWEAPPDLQAFLDAGEAPVYVGFGSMAGRNPQRLAKIVIEALQQAQVRGIIASGWGGLEASDLPQSIYQITQAPHDWLFPRMAAVVHHGGAGTTAAGLRAGRPTIICPFIADQPFWGDRVQRLGVGSQPIPHKKLTAEKLAAAIREVTTSQSIRQNAAALGENLRLEDGVATAITMIEQYTAAREPA